MSATSRWHVFQRKANPDTIAALPMPGGRMRLFGRDRDASSTSEGRALAEARHVYEKACELRELVKSVTPQEFNWQDAHYDHDSRRGRELLFLMANHEWVRATSEVVDITRADEIQTTIKVDIDLSLITQ